MLGIEENNLPLPNAGEWELKGQRADSASLITLFHSEPSPRAFKFVPQMLLPNYGWPHAQAGEAHGEDEKSFRQTLTAGVRTNRGFTIVVNRQAGRLEVSFDHKSVDRNQHSVWLQAVEENIGLGELDPQPYWGFDDLYHTAGTKLKKTHYATAERKREGGTEYFRYQKLQMLEGFQQHLFIDAVERGDVLVDFDARTGHNHGTKFRLKQGAYTRLYSSVLEV